MVTYTPSPWTVTDNSWQYSSVYGPTGELVAECPISSDADEDTQDEFEATKEANARLVAAAPDLLEALKDARFALYGNGPGNPKIDAAIAKAEGRS